jgi:hypothetical protein
MTKRGERKRRGRAIRKAWDEWWQHVEAQTPEMQEKIMRCEVETPWQLTRNILEAEGLA